MKRDGLPDRLETLSSLLESCNEGLADICTDLLHDALNGDAAAQRIEREIQKARRSVAKAERVLREISSQRSD